MADMKKAYDNLVIINLYFFRLPPEPKEEKAEGKPVSQLRFRIPATHTRESDETATDAASANVTNGETKSGEWFLAKCLFSSEMLFKV